MQHSISTGKEGDSTLRAEETLLPMTRTLEWGGGTVDATVMYFIAFGNGQLLETAFDYYIQDDAGNLYYVGEDVTNYENGQIRDHEGTWLIGRDGAPPGLFIPAKLEVGMTWHPEDRPGLVREEDQVMSVSESIMTPRGAITDGIRNQETLMNGKIEFKTWVRGFCDVVVNASDEQTQMVLMNYTTDEHRAVPVTLNTIEAGAEAIFDGAANAAWDSMGQEAQNLQDAWKQYLEQNNEPLLPVVFQDAMNAALEALQLAMTAKDSLAVRQAANDVSFAVIDLFTYYNPALPADLGRMDALERQVLIDLDASDLGAATDTLAQATAIWVRLRPLVLAQKDGVKAALEFETSLNAQVAAVATQESDTAAQSATEGLELVDSMERVF